MLRNDQYAYTNALHGTHPAEKMVFSLTFLLFGLIVRDEIISIIIFTIMTIAIIQFAKISWKYYIKILLLPTSFVVASLLSILLSFAHTNTALPPHHIAITINEWTVYVSHVSVVQAREILFMTIGSMSCLYFLIVTTSIQAICQTLKKWHVPPLFIELCDITYRFIFIFLQSVYEMYRAQQSRLGYRNMMQSLRSVSFIISGLFSSVFLHAKNLSNAMQSRSGATTPLYWEEEYCPAPKNWFYIITTFVMTVFIYIAKEFIS